MIFDLPRELTEEILCRVPATSLKRLRSTCKRWNSLLNNEGFTKKHLDRAPKEFLTLVLKDARSCWMSLNLHGTPSVEVTGGGFNVYSLTRFGTYKVVSHCDGLLLCTFENDNRIVVWNPCTSQTRWIQPRESYSSTNYALGSYKDKEHPQGNSYKILSYMGDYYSVKQRELAVYEINSDSWRVLDVTFDWYLPYSNYALSLKGKSYWLATCEEHRRDKLGMFLLSFDYTTERFHSISLPLYEYTRFVAMSLSLVREEKVVLLLQSQEYASKTEIWVTNKIGAETGVVSWNMAFAVDLDVYGCGNIWHALSLLVDEEKKVIVWCETDVGSGDDESLFSRWYDGLMLGRNVLVRSVGEDNRVMRLADLGRAFSWSILFNYVPSLIQIQQVSEAKE